MLLSNLLQDLFSNERLLIVSHQYNLPRIFQEGEKLLEKVATEGIIISVETKTALLKVSANTRLELLNDPSSWTI